MRPTGICPKVAKCGRRSKPAPTPRLETAPEAVNDAVAELAAASAALGSRLHPHTAASLAALVRIMNSYYSNLIEGHDTRPRDIERALAGDIDTDEGRRNLQLEAAAHVRVQAEIDGETRYSFASLGKGARILAIPTAHHRLNYIHPFPDGNGRVSRLMSHAMAHQAGIGAHGLWSVSRGMARGLESCGEYKRMMDLADTPRQGDLDGRGNLSRRALEEYTLWFLRVCIDQVRFMSEMFELNTLGERYRKLVARHESLKPESANLLVEALVRGEIERGEAPRITGLPERTARRVLNDLVEKSLLASRSPKGPVSLRFPVAVVDELFPKLYAVT